MPTNNKPFRLLSHTTTWVGIGIACLIPLMAISVCAFCRFDEKHLLTLSFTWSNFHWMGQSMIWHLLWRSLQVAFEVTLYCLLIAYMGSLALQQLSPKWRIAGLAAVIIPFWTSTLIRTYAILALIKAKGVLSQLLLSMGMISQPLNIAFTPTATMIGLVYNLLPFMLIPITLHLGQINPQLYEAAKDLGANKWQRFWRITLPLSRPGATLGCLFVFLPAISLFYIPSILGGAKSYLLGNLITDNFRNGQWPHGAALCLLLIVPVALISIFFSGKVKT